MLVIVFLETEIINEARRKFLFRKESMQYFYSFRYNHDNTDFMMVINDISAMKHLKVYFYLEISKQKKSDTYK